MNHLITSSLATTSTSSISTASLQSVTCSYRLRIATASFQHGVRTGVDSYSYTTLLVPTYVVIIVHDNGTYGPQRVSKDIIFDESCVFDKYIDNSPSDAEVAALALPIEDITPVLSAPDIPVSFEDLPVLNVPPPIIPTAPPLRMYEPEVYRDMVADFPDPESQPFPLVVADPSEYVEQINQYGYVQY